MWLIWGGGELSFYFLEWLWSFLCPYFSLLLPSSLLVFGEGGMAHYLYAHTNRKSCRLQKLGVGLRGRSGGHVTSSFLYLISKNKIK